MNNRIVFILGPTSSGKSAVAVNLAEKIDGEIISCDSMQIYKDMDVVTQVPLEDQLLKAKHHLIKTISPEEEYNAAKFSDEAFRLIESLNASSKTPIFAGEQGFM